MSAESGLCPLAAWIRPFGCGELNISALIARNDHSGCFLPPSRVAADRDLRAAMALGNTGVREKEREPKAGILPWRRSVHI